jgi:uncharacterized protein (TIGR03437 family)
MKGCVPEPATTRIQYNRFHSPICERVSQRWAKGRIRLNSLKSHLFFVGGILVSLCSHAGAAALPFGQTQTGTISSAAQSNSYTFSADANDVVDFTAVTTSGNLSPKIRLYNSAGTQIAAAYPTYGSGLCNGGSTVELNTVTLPTTGIYTVLAGDCGDTNTGNYSIYAQRTNNPTGATGLPFGGQPEKGTIASAAQSNSYTFSGSANDLVDFTLVSTGGTLSPKIRVYNPAGTQLADAYPTYGSGLCNGGATVELNTVTLPATGNYTVLVGDCGDTNSGNYSIYAQRTGNPVGAAVLVFGGQGQTGTISSATQSNSYTFSANANDVVDFTMVSTSSNLSPKIRLYNSAGTQLADAYPTYGSGLCNGGSTVELNTVTLPAAGAYTVLVGDCGDTNTGNYSMYAQRTNNPTEAAALPLGGQTQAGTIVAAAQSNSYTFGASANDVVNFTLATTSGSLSPKIRIYDPTGAQLADAYPTYGSGLCNGGATVELNSVKLPATGTYTVLVGDCGDTNAGKYDLSAQCFGVCTAPPPPPPPPATCNYTLAPASQLIPAAAGAGAVGVLTTAGCQWTASSGASFLSITSGSSGTGSGVVQFSATANTSPAAQVGTLTIAGITATINQAGTAPLLLLSPTSITVQWKQQSPLPAAIPLSVFTAANPLSFTATASSIGDWLTVSPASGSAPATIIVTVNPSALQPGPYQGTVTVTAPAGDPSSQSLTVSLMVIAPGPPALSVTTTSLSYSFTQGAQQVQQQRILIGNSGGGTLTYTASSSTASGGNWLSVTDDGAGATLLTPDPLTVSVDPSALEVGTYTGQITITAAATIRNIPVTVTVSAAQQSIRLSEAGLTFTAVADGGIVPPQTLGILNGGAGSMDWSVSSSTVTGGNNWLATTPTSGTTDASSLTVPLVTVSVDPGKLAPGQYSGQIRVTSPTADDTPQLVSVIMNVLPARSNPGPLVLPSGLVFTQAAGGAAAGSQTITLSNLTAAQQTFNTGTLTIDGANWLSVTPATGDTIPSQATTLTVSVGSTGLSPAIRRGVLTLIFQDGSVRTVNVLYLLVTGGVSSNSTGSSRPLNNGESCTPTELLPLVTSLGSQFAVPAEWPNTLAVQVVDDCGNPDLSGTVTATFSNGDPQLALVSAKNGNWTGTWQVNNANASAVAITVNADNPSLNISGSTSVSGSLQSSANAPVMAAGGVLNAASFLPSAPLSPGTIVSIFGSNLANGSASASKLPLGTQLSGTQVVIGGMEAPLLYADQGQINAIIPYGLQVNTNTQVIVLQGNAYTSPQSITLAPAQPGFFTVTQNGTGQAIVIAPNGKLAQPGNPAKAGDEVVFYGVGLGGVTPTVVAGAAASSSPLMTVSAAVSLTIGGHTASVKFAGLTPGFAGLYQVNALVPAGVTGNSVPVVLTVAEQPSPTVTMAVQ